MKNRFLELDFLRGLAVLGMVVFHAFFVLDFYEVLVNDMYSGWWLVLGQFVRFSFLGLVGVSMVISYGRSNSRWRQIKRGIKVLTLAMLITLVTYVVIPEQYVKFGILHLIALSILVLSMVVDRKYSAFVIATLIIFFGYFSKDINSLLSLDFGRSGIDYFPIFPWVGVIAMGVFVGHLLYPGGKARFEVKMPGKLLFIYFLGRKALMIYVLHVPLLVGIFWGLGLLEPF